MAADHQLGPRLLCAGHTTAPSSRMLAGMCKNPQVDMDGPAVAELMASVAAAVSRRVGAVSEDVYEVVLREILQASHWLGSSVLLQGNRMAQETTV
ncbi:MAG: hypothetical protein ACRDOB_18555 [Streptosporangiaceae bacterium]